MTNSELKEYAKGHYVDYHAFLDGYDFAMKNLPKNKITLETQDMHRMLSKYTEEDLVQAFTAGEFSWDRIRDVRVHTFQDWLKDYIKDGK